MARLLRHERAGVHVNDVHACVGRDYFVECVVCVIATSLRARIHMGVCGHVCSTMCVG